MAWLWPLVLLAANMLVALPAHADGAPYGAIGLGGIGYGEPSKAASAAARAALMARVVTVQADDLARKLKPAPIESYQQWIARAPDDPDACQWQERIALAAVASGDLDREAREILRLGDVWWSVRSSNHPEAIKRACQTASQALLRPLATIQHDAFSHEPVPVDVRGEYHDIPRSRAFDHASRAYEGVLRSSQQRTVDTEVRLRYAGLLHEYAARVRLDDRRTVEASTLYRRAHEVYREILETDPDGKDTEMAAYAQLVTIMNALRYDVSHGQDMSGGCRTDSEGICVVRRRNPWREPDPLKQAEIPRPEIPYSPADLEMLAAFATAIRHFSPGSRRGEVRAAWGSERAKILFLSAYLKLRRNHLEAARLDFELILRDHDDTAHAAWSAELLMGLLAARWRAAGNTPDQRTAAAEALVQALERLRNSPAMRHAHAHDATFIYPVLFAAVHEERGLAALAAGDPLRCATLLAAIHDDSRYALSWRDEVRIYDETATCYRAAGQPGMAIRHRRESLTTSDHLAHFIDDYLALGRFDAAAERMYAFAQKYPDDPRAVTMLADAHQIYVGLGDHESTSPIRTLHAKLAGPHASAELAWSQYALLPTAPQRLAHLRELLAGPLRRDLRAVANAELGAVLWRSACPLARDHELCGDLRSATFTVHPRDPELSAEALRNLRRAARLARGGLPSERLDAARAMTELYLVDADLESGLRRGARSSQLPRRYTAISRLHQSPRWTLAALARAALTTADRSAAQACLARAHALGRDDGSSRLCARLAGHPGDEFIGDATYTASHPQQLDVQRAP